MTAPDLYVVAVPFKHGDRDFLRGDRYERAAVSPMVNDALDRSLKATSYVVPLTRETYANAIAHRAPKTIGRGFTTDVLVEHGVITEIQAVAVTPSVERYKGYTVSPVQGGPFHFFQVTDAAGTPMRKKMFKTHALACLFIDGLPEISDDHDLQPEPVGLHQQGAAISG